MQQRPDLVRNLLAGQARSDIEAVASDASTLATGCPFCMIMLTDAAKSAGGTIAVREVAEIAAERLTTSS